MSHENVKFLYDTHYYEGKKVTFPKKDLKIAGLLFLPENFDSTKKYPAIVVTHPGGGVKEQVASMYAWNMSKKGYVTLAFDASYQGESEGEPRYIEDPYSRVEDIRSAIDYLVTLDYVDEDKIGAMGICAGGGYTMSAIQTEYRIKAAAGVSSWNIGKSMREGNPNALSNDAMKNNLTAIAAQRTKEAKGEAPLYVGVVPNSPDEFEAFGNSTIMKEGYEYYRTPRCQYPTSVNKMRFAYLDNVVSFDAFQYIDTVAPRPILLIVGSIADTAYFSEDGYERAKAPKELFKIDGATHFDLYDKPEYVSQAVAKLTEFFDKNLK